MDKIIADFSLDLSDLPAKGETREFIIIGDTESEFILEIKDNTTGYYYNFTTEAFQATKTNLEASIERREYTGHVKFPNTITTDTVNGDFSSGATAITMDTAVATTMAVGDRVTGNIVLDSGVFLVDSIDSTNVFSLDSSAAIDDGEFLSFSGDDQYDVYLYAVPGTKHAEYTEVRFADGSIDINSSKGSNSLMLQKVIYQYAEVQLTLSFISPNSSIVSFISTSDTLNISRGKLQSKFPFRISCQSQSTKCWEILKQPDESDIFITSTITIGSAPEVLPGENEYPDVSNTDTIDGVIAGGVSNVKVVMDTNVADKMKVGDKITASKTTDTVDGTVSSGIKVVMDNNVAGKMAVGDRITGIPALNAREITVAALNPDGDNVKEFSMSANVIIEDGTTLGFSPKCNRSLTTVVALNPDTDNAKEFSMSQNIGLLDGATLSFSNRKNYQWPVDNIDKITQGMIVAPDTNVQAGTMIKNYEDSITLFADTDKEEKIILNKKEALDKKAAKPTVVKGLITTQTGNVIFNKQQLFALAGDAIKIGGYGAETLRLVHGWEIIFSNINIALSPVVTTTTAACVGSTSVVLTARDGILNTVSSVSGIGIDSSAGNPIVSSGASAAGAGTVVLNKAQNIENGASLTFSGASRHLVITGDIGVVKAGVGSPTIRFDLEKIAKHS